MVNSRAAFDAGLDYDGIVREDRMLRLPQEIAYTTGGLTSVALVAVLGFATMAWLVEEQFRPLTMVLGAMSIGAIAAALLYLRRQRQYGTATLIAERPFEPGKPFGGTIVTELHTAPASPIRIRISGWSTRSEVTLARGRPSIACTCGATRMDRWCSHSTSRLPGNRFSGSLARFGFVLGPRTGPSVGGAVPSFFISIRSIRHSRIEDKSLVPRAHRSLHVYLGRTGRRREPIHV